MMRLIVETGPDRGTMVDLAGEVVIGRGADCQLRLSDESASTRHCSVRADGDRIEIRDLGSTNGTRVDGTRVEGTRTVAAGAAISVGDTIIRLQGDRGAMVGLVPTAPIGRTVVAGTVADPGPGSPPAAAADDDAALVLVVRAGPDRGKHVAVPASGSIVIGRAEDADLVLEDALASGHHTRVSSGPEGLRIRDLGSTNGTKLNGEQIDDEADLGRGDEIRIGSTIIAVTSPEGLTARAAPPTVFEKSGGGAGSGGPGRKPAAGKAGRSRTPWIAALALLLLAAIAGGAMLMRDDDDGGSAATRAFNANSKSVVRIVVTEAGEVVSSGSGVVMDTDQGTIITNSHVATGNTLYIDNPITGRRSPATLVGANPCADLALIRFRDLRDAEGLKNASIGDSTSLAVGADVVAMGYPVSGESGDQTAKFAEDSLSTTAGIVSKNGIALAFDDVAPLDSVIQHDGNIDHGSSGGPLLDANGKVVGINTAIGGDSTGAYAISQERMSELLPDLTAGTFPKWFGWNLGLAKPGLEINAMQPRGSAARAGVKTGWTIEKMGGKPVNSMAAYCKQAPATEGKTVKVELKDADGKTVTKTIAPGRPL